MSFKFYNTRTHDIQNFKPINEAQVLMYTCGPTVYNYAHIGNLRSYVFADTLRRALLYGGYNIKQVMNITDIGHLVSDADTGEDKMTKGLLRVGKELTLKNMRELAEFYTEAFMNDLKDLNILAPEGPYFASDYIKENIELIEKLQEKGFAYSISSGIYFDTEKMPNYGVLWGGNRKIDMGHARIAENSEKKNPEDFALWKKSDTNLGFESPFGIGFPGWHIECSTIGIKFLGEQFDIHTGGIDHISVHHTNEIAQSESATGKVPFVNFWLHHEFIDTSGEKMAKSENNFLTLKSLEEKGISPTAYRFWLLMAHYKTKMNFNFEAVLGAQNALNRLQNLYNDLDENEGEINKEYKEKFLNFLQNDLDTPRALALIWEIIKDEKLSQADKKTTIKELISVLGINLENQNLEIPTEVASLLTEREKARVEKNFTLADEIRKKINLLGFEVKDTNAGQKLEKI